MSILPPSPSEILSENGVLAQKISGFSVRASQQEMAETIAEAIGNNESLVCEAGTGTGKTFAYLIPALLSGKKLIVSTGTKNLQEQTVSPRFTHRARCPRHSCYFSLIKRASKLFMPTTARTSSTRKPIIS